MCIGIALYNTDALLAHQAFVLAESFFQTLGVPMTDASYIDGSSGGGNITTKELVHLLKDNAHEVKKFRVYCKDGNSLPWAVSFGYDAEHKGIFNHVDIQCDYDISPDIVREFLCMVAELTDVAYGIVYKQDNVVDAYEYLLEEGVVPMPSYEKHFVWRDETPGLFNGLARYKKTMLRMVYQYNLINVNHLDIKIAGQRLEDWIKADPIRGQITSLANHLFLWEVAVDELVNINNSCGQAGILIAWQA